MLEVAREVGSKPKLSLEPRSTFGSSCSSTIASISAVSLHAGTSSYVMDCSIPLFWFGTWMVAGDKVSAAGKLAQSSAVIWNF